MGECRFGRQDPTSCTAKRDCYSEINVALGKIENQLDATRMRFIRCSLAQHFSGINMPIIRSTI
jgi:hypothetical protein